MLIDAANQIDQEVTGSSVSALMQALREQVTGECQRIVGQNYPFNRGSQREVPIADFGRLFGTGGIMDAFFKKNLESLVDTSKAPWTYKQNISVARALPLSALREFERAEQIRQAFMPQGGQAPMLQPIITPMFTPQSGEAVRLDINGIGIQPAAQGMSPGSSIQWPGVGGIDRVILTTQTVGFFGPGQSTQQVLQQKQWGLFRFLDAAGTSWQGDSGFFTLSAGGRPVRYQIQISALPNRNPFRLPVLQEFRCPG
jgi:type VI secretion system protein ImpL